MKKEMHNPKPLMLSPGYFFEQSLNSRANIGKGMTNIQYNCMYQLQPKSFDGKRQLLHLNTMQTNHVIRPGGLMHSPSTAKNAYNIIVIEKCADKACYGPIKLHTGDIIFFDDTDIHNFINNDEIEFTALSIQKSRLGSLLPMFTKIINQRIHDTDARLEKTFQDIWNRFTDISEQKRESQSYAEAEKEILSVIMELLSEQTPVIPKLTAGEKTALLIREQLFEHMDNTISISSLAKQYQVSEQTLRNSFKSLFGYTPKIFLRLLKLNLVHQELFKSNPGQITVSRVASKWGFAQMGQFTAYYTELFEENPSVTLKTTEYTVENIHKDCTLRQEEMT